jgi:hypothetical protein
VLAKIRFLVAMGSANPSAGSQRSTATQSTNKDLRMRSVTRLIVLVAIAALAGCASVPSAGIDDAKKLPADGGVVAVQVVTNSAHLSDSLPNWTEVIVVQDGVVGADGKPVVATIPALIDGLSTTRVFVGVLKPGRYRFAGLGGFAKPGDFAYSMNAAAPPTVGTFHVQTNHLTNLGTVLFQPFHPDPLATSMLDERQNTPYAMSRLDDATSLAEFVSQRYPEQFRLTQANPALGWAPDAMTERRIQLASAIKAYAMLSQPHYLARTQEIVYTARLGTLYERQHDGKWSTCHVPTNYELLAYDELPDGTVVTSGERGGVWYASRRCGDWQSAALPDKAQDVIWIGANGSDAIHAVTNEQGRYRIYSAPLDGKWSWHLVKEFGAYDPPNYLNQALHAEPAPSVYQRNGIWFLSARTGAYEFDTRAGTFGPSSAESMFRAVTQPDGTIVTSTRSAWIGTKPPHVSRDGGKTWDEYQRLGTFGATPYVFSNGDALATNGNASFVFIGWKKNQTIEVVVSHDKGKTSQIVGHVPYGCDQLQTRISQDDLIFMRCFDGSLLRSVDRGKTWVADFSRAVRSDAVPREFLGKGIDAPQR